MVGSPSASWQIDPRDVVSAGFGYDAVSYTESELTGRPGYQGASAQTTWSRSLAPQHKVSIGLNFDAFYSDYPRSKIENDSVTYGMNVGYDYVWSEYTTMGLTAGAARSDITLKGLPLISTSSGPLPCLDPVQNVFVLCKLKTDDTNFVGQIYLSQRSGQTITTSFSLGRSIQPSSDGAQVTDDFARAYLAKDFSPMLTGNLGITYSRQRAVGAQNDNGIIAQRFSRDFWNAQAGLNWRLNRTWQASASYGYSQDGQTGGFTDETATKHRIDLIVKYAGLGNH